MEDDKLIDIDMWVNRHEAGDGGAQGGAAPTGFSSGIPQTGGVAERAKRADVADRANEADHANTADESNHAKKADEATRADEAEHAKSADEANHAKTADEVNLESETLSHFLRNDIPNTAAEVVTFLKGVIAKAVSYFKGIVNDGDITNSGTITTKNLNVTGKATFFELMIQITKAAGGMTIYSPGAFHIDAVEDTGDYFACFQRAEKDGVKLRQMCDVDDQLMCARFNVDGNGNKFYWMRVSYISSNTVQHVVDGKLVDCLEVRLDKSVKSDNCQGVPEIGDALAVFGNRTKEDRQSVIVISAYNSFDIDLHAPYIAQYEHVNDFNLESKKTTWLSKGENHLTGTFTVVSGGKYMSLDDFVTKISQATFKVEADKITARIDGVEKTLSDTTKKYSELQITLNSISSTVARKSDLENVRSEIKQTAEEISLSVSNGTRPNLLWGSDLNLDGVDTTSKAAIQKHLGVGLGEIKVDDAEYFKYLKGGGVAGSDAVMFKSKDGVARWTFFRWEKIKVKPNTVYTMSAWVKFKPNRANANQIYVGVNETVSTQDLAFMEGSDSQYYLAEIKDWERRHWTFKTKDETLITVLFAHSGTDESLMWLCRPKLEEGNTVTPWCAYDGTVDALKRTGIDILTGEIVLDADKTTVKGDLTAKSLQTEGDPAKGGGTVVAKDGVITFYGVNKSVPGIEIGLNEAGEPVLKMYKNGKFMYDLGPDTIFEQVIERENGFTPCDMHRICNTVGNDMEKSFGGDFPSNYRTMVAYVFSEGYKRVGNQTRYKVSETKEISTYNGVHFVEQRSVSGITADQLESMSRIADGWYLNGGGPRVSDSSAPAYDGSNPQGYTCRRFGVRFYSKGKATPKLGSFTVCGNSQTGWTVEKIDIPFL